MKLKNITPGTVISLTITAALVTSDDTLREKDGTGFITLVDLSSGDLFYLSAETEIDTNNIERKNIRIYNQDDNDDDDTVNI